MEKPGLNNNDLGGKTVKGCFHRSAVLSDGLRGGGSLTQQLKLCSFGTIRHKQKCKMKLSLTEGFSTQYAPCVLEV